jgi:hypothetical protein
VITDFCPGSRYDACLQLKNGIGSKTDGDTSRRKMRVQLANDKAVVQK